MTSSGLESMLENDTISKHPLSTIIHRTMQLIKLNEIETKEDAIIYINSMRECLQSPKIKTFYDDLYKIVKNNHDEVKRYKFTSYIRGHLKPFVFREEQYFEKLSKFYAKNIKNKEHLIIVRRGTCYLVILHKLNVITKIDNTWQFNRLVWEWYFDLDQFTH